MKFSEKELEVLSICIINRISQMSEAKKALSGFPEAMEEVDKSMDFLKKLNVKIGMMMAENE